MSLLSFDCRHRYPSGFVLEASFEADQGVTALFGASGAGKSTVFALIAGLLRLQQGRIVLGGRVLADGGRRVCLAPERRRVGVVFQDLLLFPHLTVRQNLLFGRHGGRGVDFGRVVEVLELEWLLERRPGTLSGGQRQRTALGRALLHGPELLLLDEPLSALDEGLKGRVLAYLERVLGEWRIPTLFISHDQADVRRLAERVVVLEAGRVVGAGPTATVLDRVLLREAKRPALVNLLRLDPVRQAGVHWEGLVGEQVLHLREGGERGGPLFVQFLPRDVTLVVDVPGLVSARNRLRGVVRELVELPGATFVAVDVGQFLWAEVTAEAVQDLGLRAGKAVVCLIKSTAVEVVR